MTTSHDHRWMARCLDLAEEGAGFVSPNPMVGCVIVGNDGTILGKGWHRQFGGPHAEVHAVKAAEGAGHAEQLPGSTLYVNLEPCSYHGRTPSCARALIKAGIARVVAATEDPNPSVNGKGFEMLRHAGMQVDIGLRRNRSEALNPGFSTRMRSGLPWVRVVVNIESELPGASPESNAGALQHWRARSSAVLTQADIETESRTFNPPAFQKQQDRQDRFELLLKSLGENEVNEVQVEAGARLSGALLRRKLVDEILIYQAPILLGEGAQGIFAIGPLESMTERTHLKVLETAHFGDDLRIHLQPEFGC